MSSWTIEQVELKRDKDTYFYISFRWSKGGLFEVFVGCGYYKHNEPIRTLKSLTYATQEQARQSYLRYVRKAKKGMLEL